MNSRQSLRGDPSHPGAVRGDPSHPGAVPPCIYPVRNLPPVMIAGPPSITRTPMMGFVPYPNTGLPRQPAARLMYPYHTGAPVEQRATLALPANRMLAPAPTPVDMRNNPPVMRVAVKPHIVTPPQPSPKAPTAIRPSPSSEQPLDLSVRPKQRPSPSKEKLASESSSDMPLDLSKPLKQSTSVVMESKDEKPINLAVFNRTQPCTQPLNTFSPPSSQKTSRPNSSLRGFSTFSSATDTATTTVRGGSSTPSHSSDTDSEAISSSIQSMSSVSSLIGNHPIDDILYLHCKRCQSSYGSVHAFRKHFRNVHGTMPSSEDVLIQSIKATKEFVASKNDTGASSSISGDQHRFHCTYCGWQGDSNNQAAFTRHLNEHYHEKGSVYRCYYCRELSADANSLTIHMAKHQGVFLNICSLCFIAFELQNELARHLNIHHRMIPKQQRITSVPPSFPVTPFSITPTRPVNNLYRSNSIMNGTVSRLPINIPDNNITKRTVPISPAKDFSRTPHSSSGWPSPSRAARHAASSHRKMTDEASRSSSVSATSSSGSHLISNTNSCVSNSAASTVTSTAVPMVTPTATPTATLTAAPTATLHSVLNAAINLAVTSSTVADETSSSGESKQTQINLMSLLDRVVEQGLRNADSPTENESQPATTNDKLMANNNSGGSNSPPSANPPSANSPSASLPSPSPPSTSLPSVSPIVSASLTASGVAVVSSSVGGPTSTATDDDKDSECTSLKTGSEPASPKTHKMSEKTLIDHIADAVTRQLSQNGVPINNISTTNISTNNQNGHLPTIPPLVQDCKRLVAEIQRVNLPNGNMNGGVDHETNSVSSGTGDAGVTGSTGDCMEVLSDSDNTLPPAFVIDETVTSNTPSPHPSSTTAGDFLSETQINHSDSDQDLDDRKKTASSANNTQPSNSSIDSDSESSSPKRLRIDLDSGTEG